MIDDIDIDDAIKSFKSLGIEGDELKDILKKCGLEADEVSKKLIQTSATGTKGIGKLKTAFAGLAAKIGVSTAALGTMLGVAAGVIAIGLVISAIHTTPAEAIEKMEQSVAEFQSAKQEVSDLNAELETTKTRIEELESKGGLTFVEQSELAKLKEATHQLEIQIDLAERKAALEAKEAAADTVKAYNKNFKHYASAEETKQFIDDLNAGIYEAPHLAKGDMGISGMMAVLQSYKAARDEFKNEPQLFKTYSNYINEITDSIWQQAVELQGYKETLLSIPEAYRTESQNQIIRDIDSQIEYIYQELDPSAWKQIKLDKILSKSAFVDIKNELVDMAKASNNVGVSAKDVQSYYSLASALSAAGISYQEFADYVNSEAGIVDFDAVANQLKEAFASSVGSMGGALNNPFNEWINSLTPEELQIAYEIYCSTDTALWSLSHWQTAVKESVAITSSILETEFRDFAAYQEKVSTAIESSNSAIGLGVSEIDNLTDAYKDLEGFDPGRLFEETAQGIHLNKEELRRLNTEFEKNEMQKYADEVTRLWREITLAQAEGADTSALEEELNAAVRLMNQYEALTSSYNKWLAAKSGANERDGYENVIIGKKDVEDRLARGWVDETVRTYTDMLSSEDLSNATAEEILLAYQKLKTKKIGSFSIFDFFTQDKDGNATSKGVFNFLDAVIEKQKEIGKQWVTIAEDGSYNIDFGFANDAEVAKELGIDLEALHLILKAMQDAGFEINIDPAYSSLVTLRSRADEAKEVLESIDGFDVKLDFDTGDIDSLSSQLDDMVEYLNTIEPGTKGFEEAQYIIAHLYNQLRMLEVQPPILRINTSKLEGDTKIVVETIKALEQAYAALELATLQNDEVGISEAKAQVEELTDALKDCDAASNLGITADMDAAEILNTVKSLDETGVTVSLGVDDEVFTTWQEDNSAVEASVFIGNVDDQALIRWKNKISPISIQTKIQSPSYNENLEAYNNRHGFAQGTAYAQGSPKIFDEGDSLGGEMGPELLVRNGRFYTIGKDSAEIFRYKKGDIIFNAEQTRQIFKNGKIKNGAKRGVAYAQGNAFSGGSGSNLSDLIKDVLSAGKTSASTTSSSKDEDKLDWIEVALDRIVRAINTFKDLASSAYKSLKNTVGASKDAITLSVEQLQLQRKSYDRYIEEANKIGLSSELAQLVKSGAVDISAYDEDTRKKIDEFKNWYEKALDAEEEIVRLQEDIASMYEDIFDKIKDNLDKQIDLQTHYINRYEHGQDVLEAQGRLESTQYHISTKDIQTKNLAILETELNNLKKAFSESMSSGLIEEHSDAWYEMQLSINEVKEQIDEVNLSLLETDKIIREIEWSHFDYLQERISRISSEADFLVELLSGDKLFTEEGKLTEQGMATMGLHGVNYNTYMAQADQYAAEIKKLNEEIANDPYNTSLIERREELLDLQQESILSAEAEKQAIVDLVQEGINLEIESLNELIDAYKESLDGAKSLYDYNNKINDQTSDISNIRKQIAAYEGNDSEEARATLQKLRTELSKAERNLEETQYDKYISDQKSLLDSLITEYEEVLNNRIDDIDALISETVDTINANSDLINDTINNAASDVGYTLTDNMQNIWDSSTSSIEGIISTYGDGFNQHLTSLHAVLSNINTSVSSMIAASDTKANETIEDTSATTTPIITQPPVTETPKEDPVKKPATQPQKKITIGGKINAGNAKIYTNAYGEGGGKQYFSSDPIYTVLDESNGYLKVRHHSKSSGVSGWFKKSDVKAYKKGGLVDYTGTAWVDGTTSKPEAFLNAQDTANFAALKDTLETMRQRGLTIGSAGSYNSGALHFTNISDISGLLSSIRDQRVNETGSSIGEINITIPIDHVQDYNDFITKMRDDNRFEKMVQSMTIDRVVGGSSLSKNKHRWS